MSNGRSRPGTETKRRGDDFMDRLWQQEIGDIKFGERTGDAKVQEFINEAMKKAQGKTRAEKIENAWLNLKDRRDTYNERVDELVAAEQYLFARSRVASHHAWFPVMNVLVRGYQSYKWLFYSLGLENLLLRASDERHIPSPPSDMQMRWGLRGAKDGMGDQQIKLQQMLNNEFKKVRIQSELVTHPLPQKRFPSVHGGGSIYREPEESPMRAWVKTVTIPKVDINASHYVSHKVRYGDRVWYLAAGYGYQDRKQFTEDVRKLNPGIDFNRLKPGQLINIPSKIKTPELSNPYALQIKQPQMRFSRPEANFLKNIWQQGITKSRPSRLVPPNNSFVDPIKQGAQILQTTPGPVRPIFDSTTDLLKHMERRAEEQQRTQEWLQSISHDLNRGFKSKPFQSQSMLQGTPINSPRDMWDRGINKSRPIDPFSGKPQRSVLEVGPLAPLDSKYHWVFPPDVITRSRPEINPLRQMSRGLR